jgi:pantetheine-phosphate adenylyltransferase
MDVAKDQIFHNSFELRPRGDSQYTKSNFSNQTKADARSKIHDAKARKHLGSWILHLASFSHGKMRNNMKRVAVYPGTFDPITNGHIDLINRALEFVDELIIAILVNSEKKPLFSVRERIELIKQVLPENKRIRLEQFDGLLVDYATKVGAQMILRGLRAVSDFDYEFQMALMNRRLKAQIETVFLVPAEQYSYVSSRLVKEIANLGGAVTGLVPPIVEKKMKEKFQRMKGTKT